MSQAKNNDLNHKLIKENFEKKNENKIESIKFENVSFSYDERKILDAINLDIQKQSLLELLVKVEREKVHF